MSKRRTIIGIVAFLIVVGAAVGFSFYSRWAFKQPPRPELGAVSASQGLTHVTIELNPVELGTLFARNYGLEKVEIDGCDIIDKLEHRGSAEYSNNGSILIVLPVEAISKVKLSGLLDFNGRRYNLSCSISKAGGSWKADYMRARRVERAESSKPR